MPLKTNQGIHKALTWRVVDIAVGAAVGVMSGVMFWVFDGLSYGLFPLMTLILPGSAALLHALFYFPATLGSLIVAQAGSFGLRAFGRIVRRGGTRHEIQCEPGGNRIAAGGAAEAVFASVPLPSLDARRHHSVCFGDWNRLQLLPAVLLLSGIHVLQPARHHRHYLRAA